MHDNPIVLTTGMRGKIAANPMTKKILLTLPSPSLADNRGDVERLRDALHAYGTIQIPVSMMQKISQACHTGQWEVTTTLGLMEQGWTLVDIQAGNAPSPHWGIALDLGTTTIVGYLVDMQTGDILATEAAYNGQMVYGEDILTRIYVASEEKGLANLRQAVLETINTMMGQLTEGKSQGIEAISAAVIGANTTMIQLLLGLDPSRTCMMPYVSTVNRPGCMYAKEVGLHMNPWAPVYCMPSVGSYVGGDVLGGIIASGMYQQEETSLLVDIGTNGEIVLGNQDWLVACAGAAGPALEGGVVHSGMRAMAGAIWQVKFHPETKKISYQTIDNVLPLGICGSGLIDFLAEAFLAGIIDRAGKFTSENSQYCLVPAEHTANGQEIVITQVDLDNLMRTKGAVNAALEFLLESVGCNMEDIKVFYAAGAFGQYLDVESAVTVGIFPDLPRDRIIRLGNTSAEGARQILLSLDKKKDIEHIANHITYFELNANQIFMNKFVGSKFIPHTNIEFFPSVKHKLSLRKMLGQKDEAKK